MPEHAGPDPLPTWTNEQQRTSLIAWCWGQLSGKIILAHDANYALFHKAVKTFPPGSTYSILVSRRARLQFRKQVRRFKQARWFRDHDEILRNAYRDQAIAAGRTPQTFIDISNWPLEKIVDTFSDSDSDYEI